MKCWICGADANTGEHLIKASDLKSLFGHITQSKPIYLHTDARRNLPIRGLKSEKLKFAARICGTCNNQRTQPHDRAWEALSEYLRTRTPPIKGGTLIRLDKVFPGAVKRSMLEVHLFFIKQFGCLISENSIPLDITKFAESILQQTPHPKVHLRFVTGLQDPRHKLVSRSVVQTASLPDGRIAYATWFYVVDRIAVNVIYAEPMERRTALVQSWHPSSINKRVRIFAYDA